MTTASDAGLDLPPPVAAVGYRTLRVGSRSFRVVPPSIHDPRIHLSSVILTILFLGITWLGFRVSLPQIGLTLLTCAVMELVWTYHKRSMFVWPASALQTATSVALLFRVVGTENGDYWSFRGWYLFVAVGAFSLLTKYLIRFSTGHVFNPSNIGLIVAFLLLGSQRVEPLDYWWAPFGPAMAAAYAVIFFGGFWICGRLGLLGLGLTFWITLAAGLGVVAASGHCITTRWSFTPICGAHFWWIILTSPEILIFLFFMITDPKTVPAGRVARVVFGGVMGVVCTILIAPWQTEFGAKVGLLSGLAVMCATRPLLERRLPVAGSSEDHPVLFLTRLLTGDPARLRPVLLRGVSVLAVVGLLGVGVAAAGTPARDSPTSDPPALAVGDASEIDPASLPTVSIDPAVAGLSAGLGTAAGAQDLAATLAWNLQVEAEAMATGDATLLPAVDDGARLQDMQASIEDAAALGHRVIPTYTFDSLHLMVVFPGGLQRGANAGLVASGTVTEAIHSADGKQVGQSEHSFAMTFSLRPTTSGRWLTTDTMPPAA